MLENNHNQSSKFRTKTWVKVNDESHERCNPSSEIKFKTTMLRSRFCNYSDGYILGKVTITMSEAAADAAARKVDKKNQVTFKN